MLNEILLKPGFALQSPGGRRLEVGDIFVPRHDHIKSQKLPASFRNHSRKIVLFRDGSIAPLADVKRRFHPAVQANGVQGQTFWA